ncbi:MAG: hypothetical protein SGBAC_007198 [Bacillariaceae sp.]
MSVPPRRTSHRASITRQLEQEERDQAEVFYYSGIERVPNYVTVVHLHEYMKSVPYEAFYLKKVLRKVQFHDASLRVISERAFGSCSALEEAILPDSIEEIERGAFSNCTSLHTVYISPKARLLTVIAQGAFSHCNSLVSFQVPPSVRVLERAAFSRCERLQHVEFMTLKEPSDKTSEPLESQLECIQPIVFGGCTGLQTLRLPHGLKQIQTQAFSGCTWLDAIEIPATVNQISSLAFSGCHNLKHVSLPQGMNLSSDMPNDIFRNCHLLNPMVLSAMAGAEGNGDSMQVLQNRFEGLPIHELCYYSQDREVLEQVLLLASDEDAGSSTQDCFRMSPFHLLALSGNRNKVVLGLLKMLLKNPRFQKVVAKKDIWGYAPLVYACQVDAPLPVVKLLLEAHQAEAIKSKANIEASKSPGEETKTDGAVEDARPLGTQNHAITTSEIVTVPWDHLVRHCVSNSVKILRFIVRSCLKERLQRLGLQQWKTDVTFQIFQIPVTVHPEEARTGHIRALCRQLSGFEEREALAILELAVWKGALSRAISHEEEIQEEMDDQHQIEEGAKVKVGQMDGQGSSENATESNERDNELELEEETPEEILRKARHHTRVTCNSGVILINVRQYFKIPPTDFF